MVYPPNTKMRTATLYIDESGIFHWKSTDPAKAPGLRIAAGLLLSGTPREHRDVIDAAFEQNLGWWYRTGQRIHAVEMGNGKNIANVLFDLDDRDWPTRLRRIRHDVRTYTANELRQQNRKTWRTLHKESRRLLGGFKKAMGSSCSAFPPSAVFLCAEHDLSGKKPRYLPMLRALIERVLLHVGISGKWSTDVDPCELNIVIEQGGLGTTPTADDFDECVRLVNVVAPEPRVTIRSVAEGGKSIPGLCLADCVAYRLGPRHRRGTPRSPGYAKGWSLKTIGSRSKDLFGTNPEVVLVGATVIRQRLLEVLNGDLAAATVKEEFSEFRRSLPPGHLQGVVEQAHALVGELERIGS